MTPAREVSGSSRRRGDAVSRQDVQSRHIDRLSQVCEDVMQFCTPDPEEVKQREEALREIETHVRKEYADANLTLFGSSCNGFLQIRSDLDICLTFDRSKDGKDICLEDEVRKLSNRLKRVKSLTRVTAITKATVPVVKFFHKPSRLEGDITLYNILAQENTRLVRTYGDIDERVRILGYTFKHFAKTWGINDASRGTLSSYAVILLMVYYLQQCNPPVIPVLQELYPDGEQKPQNIVEGWDAWFYEEIDRLPSVWPEFGRNNQTPGELWLGLLRFYTKEFNFREHVVCIRQKAPLTRLEKTWTSKAIAIEDPFKLDRDVGKSATKMTQILECLVQGYEHFKRPVAVLPRRFSTFVAYFFDERKIVVGEQSNGGGCRICGKVRHIMKDCPDRGDRIKGCQYQPRMHHRSDVEQQHQHRHHCRYPNDVPHHRHPNGLPPQQGRHPNGLPPQQGRHPNGLPPQQGRHPNGLPPQQGRHPNGLPPQQGRHPNGLPPQQGRHPNGLPPQQGRHPNGLPPQQGRHPNGLPPQQGRHPNGLPPQQGRHPNGLPPQQGRHPNGLPPQQGRHPNDTPPQQGRHPNDTPPQQGRHPNDTPPQQGRHPNGLPPQQGRHPNGLPPQQGRHPNGLPPQQGRHPNGLPPQQGRHPNGLPPQQGRHPNDTPPQQGRHPNDTPPQQGRHPNDTPPQQGRHPNDTPPQQGRHPNDTPPQQGRHPNDTPPQQGRHPNDTPPQQGRHPNDTPPQQGRHPNDTPPQQGRHTNDTPPQQGRHTNDAPPQQRRHPNYRA